MNRVVSVCAGAAILTMASASAGLAAEPSVGARNWSGWYVGANAGYGFADRDTNIAGLDPGGALRVSAGIVPSTLPESRTGLLGGLQFGANLQAGNVVYGLETDFNYAGVKDSASSLYTGAPPALVTTSSETKLDWFGTFRGRLGVAAFDRSLFYATGGLAYGRATSSVNVVTTNFAVCTSLAVLCATASSQKWMAGWTAGAGWEWALAEKWSAKAEYLYYDLGEIDNTLVPANGTTGITFGSSTRIDGHIVRIGVNYKLGAF